MKTVAITGSSGFVGKYLVKKLLGNGYRVIELDVDKGIDLLDIKSVSLINKFDIIVHLASKSFVPLSFENPYEFYHDNYCMTLNVLELAKKNKAKVIFFSSYLYGNPEYLPIDENHPLRPHNPYAQTKLISEKLCEGYNRDFKVPIIIFRPFNIYGPGQNKNFLIPSIIAQISSGKIELNDPRPKRDFVHVSDVVNAVAAAVKFENFDFEIINLGSGKSISVKELTEKISTILDTKPQITFTNIVRNGEILDTISNIAKAKQLLKWDSQMDLESGLKELL